MDISKVVFDKLFIRGMSMKTINAYEYHIANFMDWVGKSPLKVKQADIDEYIKRMRMKGYAHSSINLSNNAIKFFFCDVMKRRFTIKSLKKQDKHTGVVDKELILKAIDGLKNPKHRLLLTLLYGSGLRVGEAVRLRHEDIQGDELIVRQGKGAKDRKAALSDRFLREYGFLRKEKGFVFPGRKGHLTIRSAQEMIKKAFKGLHVHPHMMRASYATHMFEKGVNPIIIQKYTGHKSLAMVNVYTKYAKLNHKDIPSPIDT